jgi:hypothetical protein
MKKLPRKIDLKVPDKNKPNWGFNFWPFFVMLLVLWGWQAAVNQFTVRTVPYSEFRARLARHVVVDAVIKQDEIIGRIVPQAAPGTNAALPVIASPSTNAHAASVAGRVCLA